MEDRGIIIWQPFNSLINGNAIINSLLKEKSKINIEMFMLDKDSREDGSSFEFIFYENNIKYVYGFTIDTERVLEEYLLEKYTKKSLDDILERHPEILPILVSVFEETRYGTSSIITKEELDNPSLIHSLFSVLDRIENDIHSYTEA